MDRRAFLDRPLARAVAVGVFLAMVAGLAYFHREDLFPPQQVAAPADDLLAQCLAQRGGEVDRMVADGIIQETQAQLFKQRAEALCQAQAAGKAPQ